MPTSIAILFHARQTDAASMHYRIWPIAECWRRMGLRVDIVFGVAGENERTLLNADLLVPHVDCSVRPAPYQRLIERHPLVLNRRAGDIRKRRVSSLLVTRAEVESGSYWGPVIVKSNGNCGGLPDYHYARPHDAGPTLLDKVRRRVCNHPSLERRAWGAWLESLSYRFARTLTRYPIYDSAKDVPRGVWSNPHLVVERFVPERVRVDSPTPTPAAALSPRSGPLHYAMRMWIVMGGVGTGRTLTAADAYVKDRHAKLGHFTQPPSEALGERGWCARLGVDYGKLDYVVPRPEEGGDGGAVLLDVNTTPTVSGDAFSEFYVEQCGPLAKAALEWAERKENADAPLQAAAVA